jgi:hypothetical protein
MTSDQQTIPAKRDPRIRLWKTAGLVGVFVLTMLIGNFCISSDKAVTRNMIGHDFLAFYYGGTCARTGQLDKLFDLEATKAFEFSIADRLHLELAKGFAPWWNPPFAAWLFAPLSALPYLTALWIWWGFDVACLAASILLLCRMVQGNWKSKLLVPLFILTAMPFFQAITHGQNTFLSLLLLTGVVTLWRGGYSFAAGLLCGLLFYKPQLGAVVAIVLCLSQGRRALLGVSLVGLALLLVNVVTLPGTIHEFIHTMPANMRWMQEDNNYHWERHATFKGFWRLLIQGHATGPTSGLVLAAWGISQSILLVALLAAIYYHLRQPKSGSGTDRLIAAAIVSMPLLMPFYFDYDLLLLSVAAVVYVADCQRNSTGRVVANWEDRWLPRLWLAFYVTTEFAVILAGRTRFLASVPLLTAIALLLIRRAIRPQAQDAVHSLASPSPLPLAA